MDQKGQSVFEFIIFVPFLVFLFTIFYTCGSAINGSINQQKAVRGYFYSLVKGNSYVIGTQDLDIYKSKSMSQVGFFAIGWSEHGQDEAKKYAPCFQFTSILKNGTTEECDSPEREEPGESSRFVRLFTFYGACGGLYTANPVSNGRLEYDQGNQGMAACSLK